jgi:hypothetical protein
VVWYYSTLDTYKRRMQNRPVNAAGVSSKLWEITDIVALLDQENSALSKNSTGPLVLLGFEENGVPVPRSVECG